MNSSERLLRRPSIAVPKAIVALLLVLATIGFGIAIFLTVKHLQGGLPSCAVVNGCETVLTSKYASVGPVPTSVFGIAYYASLIALGIMYLRSGNLIVMKLMGWLTFIGFGVSLYLIYLMLWVVNAICLYCMASALLCILMWLIDLVIWKKYLRVYEDEEVLVTA